MQRISFARAAIAGASSRTAAVGLFLLALVLAPLPLSAHEFKIGDLEIAHPWSRATPDGAKVAAGYLVVKNHGAMADRLLAATGAIAGRTEIHEMSVSKEGVMTMRPMAGGLDIPAGGELAMKPGSFHIMFMDITRGIKAGERFAGTLTFEKAGTVAVEFAVEAMSGQPDHAGQHGG